MKIGIISDTHGHFYNLSKCVELMIERGISKIIHLGDDYDDFDTIDISNILENNIEIIRVPGVYSGHYSDSGVKNRLVKTIEGKKFLISHTLESHNNDLPDDIKPEEIIAAKNIDFVLYGHTHIPEIRNEGGMIFLNPGHLQGDDSKGYEPTFGIIDFARNTAYLYKLKTNEVYLRLKFEE